MSADSLREETDRYRAIICNGALEPVFLAKLLSLCEQGSFVADSVQGLGDREVERPQRVGRAINLALGRTALFRWVESATGCSPVDRIEGRVVRSRPNNHDQLGWHDDRDDPQRRLAITINLGEHHYQGGLFELREKSTKRLLFAHHHLEPGTALIFDIANDIEHHVLPVTSGGPRCVYTGWFYEGKA